MRHDNICACSICRRREERELNILAVVTVVILVALGLTMSFACGVAS